MGGAGREGAQGEGGHERRSDAERAGEALRLHASCVAFPAADDAPAGAGAWRGVLIRGASGVGKSAFALRLIALGARLVADDQTWLRRGPDGGLTASAPGRLSGLIEARGLGLLRLPALADAPLAWVVDLKLGGAEGRLPARRAAALLGAALPAVTLEASERSAAALCCLVRDGALLDPEADLADFKDGRGGGG